MFGWKRWVIKDPESMGLLIVRYMRSFKARFEGTMLLVAH
jgi:hypothetical protein